MGKVKIMLALLMCITSSVVFAVTMYGSDAPASSGTNARVQTNELIQVIQSINAAMDGLAQKDGAYNSADVTMANVQSLLPNNSLKTPWGGDAVISNQAKTSYVVTISNVPPEVCKQAQARLSSNPKYISANNCDAAGPVEFSFLYDSTK